MPPNNNVVLGAQAGEASTNPTGSVAIGGSAGYAGQNNYAIAIGNFAGYSGQSDSAIAIGNTAGSSGQSNDAIAIGAYAGSNNQGLGAVALGTGAGYIGQGTYAISIGFGANSDIYQNASSIVIDARGGITTATDSGFYVNPVRPVQTSYPVNYNLTTNEITYDPSASDKRLKTNINNTSLGMNFISQLRPVEFTWRDRVGIGLDSNGNPLPSTSPGKRLHQGFIAQEVKQVLDSLSTDSAIFTCINDVPSTITKTRTDKKGSTITTTFESPASKLRGIYTLRHEEFIPPTIKGLQEVYAQVNAQQSTIQSLQAQLAVLPILQAQVSTLMAKLNVA